MASLWSNSETVVSRMLELHMEKAQQFSVPTTPTAYGGTGSSGKTANWSDPISQKAKNNVTS